jgi:hypothetical protein
MVKWSRTGDGWAVNLDGTDAAECFSLPRVELRAGAGGWRSACLLADGTVREGGASAAGDLRGAKADAVFRARGLLAPEEAAALAPLL